MADSDRIALGVAGLRPGVVLPDEISGKSKTIVRVCLVIGHRCIDPRQAGLTGLVVAQQQFKPLLVIALWFLKRNAVVRMIGQTHAEAVGLHTFVRLAFLTWTRGIDER